MSKAERNREQRAREKIAAQQAAARRAQRRRVFLLGGGAIAAVIVVVVALVVVALNRAPSKQLGSAILPASVTGVLTNPDISTLNSIGTGALPSARQLPIRKVNGTPLTSGGKPELLYIGADFCPYCAAMRWPIAIALSRFGTLGHPLTGIHSNASDIYPNTATLTFYHQRYTSPYLTFTPVENETLDHAPLQPVTKAQDAIWTKYDSPYKGYPFLYFGGKVVMPSYLFDPAVLRVGQAKKGAPLSWQQVATALRSPSSAISRNVYGAANYITAAICVMTGNQPGSVCSAGPIPKIESSL